MDRVVRGVVEEYRVLSRIDAEMAERITRQTGLPIPFPPGVQHLPVVTTLEEPPEGKLLLGRGQSGLFCLGQGMSSGKVVGLKIGERDVARREYALLKELKGVPHLLQALDFCDADGVQVVELAGFGSGDLKYFAPERMLVHNKGTSDRLSGWQAGRFVTFLASAHRCEASVSGSRSWALLPTYTEARTEERSA